MFSTFDGAKAYFTESLKYDPIFILSGATTTFIPVRGMVALGTWCLCAHSLVMGGLTYVHLSLLVCPLQLYGTSWAALFSEAKIP